MWQDQTAGNHIRQNPRFPYLEGEMKQKLKAAQHRASPAMAASSSLCNSLCFFLPSKPQQPRTPPPHLLSFPLSSNSLLTLSSSSSSSVSINSLRNGDGFVPFDVSGEGRSSSSSSTTDLFSVVCPSLAYANTLFFKSAYNVQVIVDENEPEERLLNRFRREVMRAGVIQECKRRRFFENKQDEKKRKSREAAKRNRRRRPQSRAMSKINQEIPKRKEEEDEEDNWELPEGDLPY